jgi:hypothetical protein
MGKICKSMSLKEILAVAPMSEENFLILKEAVEKAEEHLAQAEKICGNMSYWRPDFLRPRCSLILKKHRQEYNSLLREYRDELLRRENAR